MNAGLHGSKEQQDGLLQNKLGMRQAGSTRSEQVGKGASALLLLTASETKRAPATIDIHDPESN